jgi:hypothetical protein
MSMSLSQITTAWSQIYRLVVLTASPASADRTEEAVFGEDPPRSIPLSLALDLGDFAHQVPDLVAVEFADQGNAVDILDEVFGSAQECLER